MTRVLITGASSGIGQQLAKDYLQEGYSVIACGRNHEKLVDALPEGNGKISYCTFDAINKQACEQALKDIQPVDLAILNAGTCEYIDDPIHFDAKLFERVITTNVLGTANCIRPLLQKMHKGSRLAIVSSSVTFLPITRSEAYGASKAALDYLARSLAIDLDDKGIAVTLVRPGFVDTPLTRKNDFPMPGIISLEKASKAIRAGLAKGKREIRFPFTFICTLQFLSWLPRGLWHRLAVKMAGAQQ